MTEVEDIKNIMRDVRENSPILLVGKYMQVFKRMYKGDIKFVNNTETVRELVSYYNGLSNLDRPLIIEDLSFLDMSASFLLLKLVEECKFPVILLSSFDRVSEIILSRIKVYRKSLSEDVACEFLPPDKGMELIKEYLSEDTSTIDKHRWMAKNSPMLYFMERRVNKNIPSREKVMRFL